MPIGVAVVAVLVVSVALLARHSAARDKNEPVPRDSDAWLESFSLRGYGPMLRLASWTDRQYLKSARDSAEAKRYRRAQRALLREYLRSLSRDFQRLHSIAAARLQRARNDESGLSLTLLEQQMGFIFLMWSIELRLAVNALMPHSIDLKPLLANVETLAAQTRELTRPRLRYQVM